MRFDPATNRSPIPLPLGERWLGEAESVRGISPLSLKHPPHPALRATFSPRGRRIESVFASCSGAFHV
ncbi:hypothetical protein SAMN05216456_2835 [Devosia crocina]|uniref:Uncharacterized protein n=1 Tax=Devosia crocina TaxID=429728 RepID=A0A1I7NRH9_9HYPH|nr:hypothetical protein SAMN05216456_2835 [Devosia crocina]